MYQQCYIRYYMETECIIKVNCCINLVSLQRTTRGAVGTAKSFERNTH